MKRSNRKRHRPEEVVTNLRQWPLDTFVTQNFPPHLSTFPLHHSHPVVPSSPASRVPRDLLKRGRQPSPERPRCRGQP